MLMDVSPIKNSFVPLIESLCKWISYVFEFSISRYPILFRKKNVLKNKNSESKISFPEPLSIQTGANTTAYSVKMFEYVYAGI